MSSVNTGLISASIIVLSLQLVFILLAYFHKKEFPPFKAKQLEALFFSWLSSVFWIFANLQSLGIFDYTQFIWSNCIWWVVWSQVVLGVGGYLIVAIYRLYRLFYMLVLTEPPLGRKFWAPIVITWIPFLIVGIVPLAIPDLVTTAPVEWEGRPIACHFPSELYYYSLYTVILIQIGVLTYLNMRIRRVQKSFNEFKEIQLALICCVFLEFISLAFSSTSLLFTPFGAPVVWLCNILSSSSFFFATLTKPMLGFLFYRRRYLARWRLGISQKRSHESLDEKREEEEGEEGGEGGEGGEHVGGPSGGGVPLSTITKTQTQNFN